MIDTFSVEFVYLAANRLFDYRILHRYSALCDYHNRINKLEVVNQRGGFLIAVAEPGPPIAI